MAKATPGRFAGSRVVAAVEAGDDRRPRKRIPVSVHRPPGRNRPPLLAGCHGLLKREVPHAPGPGLRAGVHFEGSQYLWHVACFDPGSGKADPKIKVHRQVERLVDRSNLVQRPAGYACAGL